MNGSVNGKAMVGHFEDVAWFAASYVCLVLMAGHCMVSNIAVTVTITRKHRLLSLAVIHEELLSDGSNSSGRFVYDY